MKPKRIIITPYKMGSASAKELQQILKATTNRRVLRVRKTSTTYKRRVSDYHINWGNCANVPWAALDQERAKAIARNKLKTFEKFKEHNICHPEWTTSSEQAVTWCQEGKEVVARTTLFGHSGQGIIMCLEHLNTAHFPLAPLYVQYKKKKNEYRVHVFNGQVIDVQQKKRRAGFEGRNNQIRNHQNGWVYCRDDIMEPQDLRTLAVSATTAIGLMYGAVDIIWNEKENKCYCLEINTAPGISGTTKEKYAEQFRMQL